MSPQSQSFRLTIQLLSALLVLLALVRVIGLWAHEPMLAYANNYDQVRALGALGLLPDTAEAKLGDSTPAAPYRYFRREGGRHYTYPSSDIALNDLYFRVTRWISPSSPIDIKMRSLVLLGVWLTGMLFCLQQLRKQGTLWGLGFSAWLLFICDPINTLFLNTFYSEFSAFAAFSGLIALPWLWLANTCRSRRAVFCWLALLLLFACNRQQYSYLPIVAVPLLFSQPWARSRATIAAGILALVAPLALFSATEKFAALPFSGAANRVDTILEVMLPAASNQSAMLKRLHLGPACAAFIGKNWYTVDQLALQRDCPEIYKLPLKHYVRALSQDPSALVDMSLDALTWNTGFITQSVGQVEGQQHAQLTELPIFEALSLNTLLLALTPSGCQKLLLAFFFAPLLVALFAWHKGRVDWSLAMLALALGSAYIFYTALLGDGKVDFARHWVLNFTLAGPAALTLITLPFLAWRTRLPAQVEIAPQ